MGFYFERLMIFLFKQLYGKTPIELTDNKEIIEIFNSRRFRYLDTNLIDQLLVNKTKIGEGATSTVYRVKNIFTDKGFLSLKILKSIFFGLIKGKAKEEIKKVKSFWSEEEESEKEEIEDIDIDIDVVRKLLTEYELLHKLCHPNIIKTYGFYTGDETHNPAILLEYCKFNLEEKTINNLEDFELVGIIYEICSAMKYLHKNNIIHRDLKMANILINLKKHVKICDFGIARMMDLSTCASLTQGVGTLIFMAPELFRDDSKYNEKVDVYSFGVVMYFIVTKGDLPSFNPAGLESFKLPDIINDLSQKIIKSCWSTQPEKRPSFDQIIQEIVNNNFLVFDGIESEIPQLKKHLGI